MTAVAGMVLLSQHREDSILELHHGEGHLVAPAEEVDEHTTVPERAPPGAFRFLFRDLVILRSGQGWGRGDRPGPGEERPARLRDRLSGGVKPMKSYESVEFPR